MEINQFRSLNNGLLPRWYNGKLHLLVNAFILLLSLLTALYFLKQNYQLSWMMLPIIVSAIFMWGIIEYCIHRFLLHGGKFRLGDLKRQHSYFHHQYFTSQYMVAKEIIDINRILVFTQDLCLLLAFNILLSYAFGQLLGGVWGLLVFISGILYITAYEVFHAVAHLDCAFVLLKKNILHHQRHHDLKHMEKYNFAIIFPVIDKFFNTLNTKKD